MLASTVTSCADAGLDATEYEIIVVDNRSTDGAVDALPERDTNGAPIRVYRNTTNLGRVGNWNRAVEIATDLGFPQYTFLFVGDRWLRDGSLPRLLRLMAEKRSDIGLAGFESTDEHGARKRLSTRFRTPTGESVIDASRFLASVLATGLLPFGPIQANVYRTSVPLKFDPNLARTTDVEATVEYISRCTSPVVLVGDPYFSWRAHRHRYHTASSVMDFIEEAPRMFERAKTYSGIPVNNRRAISTLFVNALRSVMVFEHPKRWPVTLAQVLSYYRTLPERVSVRETCRILFARLVQRRHLIEVS
jgi:glycosyltransferase involved in cell wall biosynthesis